MREVKSPSGILKFTDSRPAKANPSPRRGCKAGYFRSLIKGLLLSGVNPYLEPRGFHGKKCSDNVLTCQAGRANVDDVVRTERHEPASLARRTQIINCLVEGNSIRSTERMTDTHRDTIMRLMVEVGTGCAAMANDQMRNLDCWRIQCDEIWTFCRMKQARIPRFTDRTKVGDQWTFVAIDPETKLVPAYRVGKRTAETAVAFMTDLSERLSNRVQISSDSLRSYVDAVERAFGADVDYGQIVKFYDAEPIGPGVMPLRA